MKNKEINIYIIATEQSGDNLGSDLMKKMKSNTKKKLNFFGIGGNKMIKNGLKKINHISEFKYMGIIEILNNLNSILSMLNKNVKKAYEIKPDIVITIDSPDFSFRFVKRLKKKNLKSKFIHYVAPTVWAWRPSRAKYISNLYDLLLTIFPFENSYFEKYNLKTVFVGNPICKKPFVKKNSSDKNYISLLPGSRINEIKSLLPYFKSLSNHIEDKYYYKIFIPTLPHLKKTLSQLTKSWDIRPIISDNVNEINKYLNQTKLAIVCSGTASLEVSINKIPIIVVYKLNILTTFILNFLIKVKYANIINIMQNKEIIPELINNKLNSNNLIYKFEQLINDFDIRNNQIIETQKIFKKLCLKKDYSYNASKAILNFI